MSDAPCGGWMNVRFAPRRVGCAFCFFIFGPLSTKAVSQTENSL
jgi:hypothetical protein